MTKFSLVVAISLAVVSTASQFESESSAKTVIRSKRWNAGNSAPALARHANGVYQDCPTPGHKMCDKTGEYWEDIKDHFESSVWAPEANVDQLENCVSECKKEEGIFSYGGVFKSATNEEKIANYEEALEEELPVGKPAMKDCNRCIQYYDATNAYNPGQ